VSKFQEFVEFLKDTRQALSWLLYSLLSEYWLIILVFSALFLIVWLAHFLLPSGLSK
jgi:hypothetical protein